MPCALREDHAHTRDEILAPIELNNQRLIEAHFVVLTYCSTVRNSSGYVFRPVQNCTIDTIARRRDPTIFLLRFEQNVRRSQHRSHLPMPLVPMPIPIPMPSQCQWPMPMPLS